MAQAVRRHFSFRLNDLTREKISSWREGKISVILAVVNASMSIILYYLFVMKNPVYQYRVNLFLDLVLEEQPMLLVTISEPLQS
jgi:hypothetical protein